MLVLLALITLSSTQATKFVVHSRTTEFPTSFHPVALKELHNPHLPWDQYLPEDATAQKTKFFEEDTPLFRSAGSEALDEDGTFVVGPPRRLVKGKNDTFRNTPIVPLKENYMNCSFRKKNPVAYDEALYPCKYAFLGLMFKAQIN